ncbi:Zinc finger protein 112, partial [Galemys pyrenaicus]
METETQRDGCSGTKNQHNMEPIQEVGLSYFSPKELSSWQTCQQDAGRLTECPNSMKNFQGIISQFQKKGDSPCQVWAGMPIQISEDENCVLTHRGNDTRHLEFPSWRAQHSWRKMCLTESDNYHCRCQQTSLKTSACKCNSTCWISHHSDNQGVHRMGQNYSCYDCGEGVIQVSLLNQDLIQTGQKPCPCNEQRGAFKDGFSSEVQWLQGKLQTYSLCGKDCRSAQSVHRDSCVFVTSYLQPCERMQTEGEPCKCEYGKNFSHCPCLNTYKIIHTVETSYRCNVYEKAFSHSLDLNRIFRTHTREEPLEYEENRNVFNQNSCLQVHQKHNEEKQHTDVECGKSSICTSHLNIQHRVCLGENPCNSEECVNGFSLASHFQDL